MNKIKILIVDDSLTIRAIFGEMLKKDKDIQLVGAAASAREAIDLIRDKLPHVVALDINMPEVNGIGFLEEMADIPHKPAVVVVSSVAVQQSPVCFDAFSHGAIACFDKSGMITNAKKLIALLKEAAHGKIKRFAHRDCDTTLPV